ncbi:MAG: long-chain-fatty-acid--CoA ligase [Novosphingobium sp.]|nr:long-chain-fatty-acid--CoA ligase [Novosphingobium sp.]
MTTGSMTMMPFRIIDLLRHAATNHSDAEIVSRRVEGDIHRYTYAGAYKRVCRLARALEVLGVKAGTRAATLAWNTHRHFELYYGIAGIGAVCHTLNPRLYAEQIAWIADHAQDEILFFDISFVDLVKELLPQFKTIKTLVLLGDAQAARDAGIKGLLSYEDLLAAQPDAPVEWPILDENSISGLCYTSGTTGNPKGVAYTHRAVMICAYASALPDHLNLSARETVMPIVPMFHVNAWGFPYTLAMVGAKIVFPGPNLDAASLYELCETEKVTLAAGVPTIWMNMLEYLRKTGSELSTLKRISTGGAQVSPALIRAYQADRGIEMLQGWGMTETAAIGTFCRLKPKHDEWPDDDRTAYQTKQGRAVYGVELRIEDDKGNVLPNDGKTYGHLLIRGHWVINHYEGGKAGARADGWFDTGDISTIDADGYMQIVDRAKDVIKSGGEWISSVDLENAAMDHEAIAEAAVIGIPHPKWDERPLLICVRRAGFTVSADELRDFLVTKVAKWWLPETIEFVEELPHGPTGKLLKTTLREQYTAQDATV